MFPVNVETWLYNLPAILETFSVVTFNVTRNELKRIIQWRFKENVFMFLITKVKMVKSQESSLQFT